MQEIADGWEGQVGSSAEVNLSLTQLELNHVDSHQGDGPETTRTVAGVVGTVKMVRC
jgi:hypothetical protein